MPDSNDFTSQLTFLGTYKNFFDKIDI